MTDHPEPRKDDTVEPPVELSPLPPTSTVAGADTAFAHEGAVRQDRPPPPGEASTAEILTHFDETAADVPAPPASGAMIEPDSLTADTDLVSDEPPTSPQLDHVETHHPPSEDDRSRAPGQIATDDDAAAIASDGPMAILPAPPDDMADEPTTIVPTTHDDMADEPTTILQAAHEDMQDEPTTVIASTDDYTEDETTTVLHASPGDFEPGFPDEMDEPTTVLPSPEDDMADEDTQVLLTPDTVAAVQDAPGVGGHAAIPPHADVGDTTEIRLALREANADAPDWFVTRLQDFIAALRENASGTRRTPEDFQALTMTARDMLARIAMQGGANPAGEGFGADSVLQQDQLLANTYIVRSMIARGGVGEIYRTRHRDLRTEHAVKVLLPRFALDPTMLTLMQDEARLLQCVRHEAVVACQDLLRDADGRPMIVMDYLRGRTLSARLREGRLSPDELIVLARRLADGLGAIHAAGIVHQDISPDNVILTEDSCAAATIIDFGLARRLGTGRDMHRNLDFAGKFSWSSPEQLSGRPATVDARSDLYSFGLMLAAAARGFRLDMGNDLESARATRTTVPSLAGIEQPVAGLIEALLAPAPGARLASASEVAGLLEPRRTGFWTFVSGLWQRRQKA